MCEIFYAKAAQDKNAVQDQTLLKLLNQAVESASSNSDGFGIFTDNGDHRKAPRELRQDDIGWLMDFASGSEYVVLHTRMTTQGGNTKANTHPFNRDGYMLVHNGVTDVEDENILKLDDEVDSKRILKSIIAKDGDTPEQIETAMDDIAGRASIFMRDPDGQLFYWRDGGARFTFAFDSQTQEVLGATKEKRLKHMTSSQYVKRSPDEGTVYDMNIGRPGITELGSFSMNARTSNYNYGRGGYSSKVSNQSSDNGRQSQYSNSAGRSSSHSDFGSFRYVEADTEDDDGEYEPAWDDDEYWEQKNAEMRGMTHPFNPDTDADDTYQEDEDEDDEEQTSIEAAWGGAIEESDKPWDDEDLTPEERTEAFHEYHDDIPSDWAAWQEMYRQYNEDPPTDNPMEAQYM